MQTWGKLKFQQETKKCQPYDNRGQNAQTTMKRNCVIFIENGSAERWEIKTQSKKDSLVYSIDILNEETEK